MSTQAPAASAQASSTETNRWVVLVLVCLAQFMVVLDATIVNVALPSIQSDLNFSPGNLAWIINSYTLLFGGFLLLGGRAADLFGRKRVFLAGVVLFSIASMLCGLAQSQGTLIAFRALQGLGAALVSPAALSIIMTTFADGAERTKALAVWGAIAASGSAFGLLLGGFLTESLSWEWIFIVNVPIGIAAFLFSLRLIPESKGESDGQSFDLVGALLVTGGLVSLVYAIVKAGEESWGSSATLGFGALGIVLLIAFIAIETRHRDPLVRLGIFKIRSLSTSNGVMLVVAGGMFAMFFFATIYVQEVMGYSPLKAGLAFLPFTVGIIAGSVMAQQLIPRIGVRLQILGGLTLAAIGLLLMTRITPEGSYAAELLPAVIVMSIGMGNTFVPLTLLATTNVEAEDAGLASGLFNTSQQIGGALGLSILSTLAASRTDGLIADGSNPVGALVDGYHLAFLIGAVFIAAGAAAIVLLIRRRDVASINAAEAGQVQMAH
ncbi:MFS transporter [Conexibacter arvalis]|uniref:EmrB/QacA subfamily drug resistance transporter n=1 Tax=Conexibacter arvalis TaxID=912552 RepID=A0A840IF62_9ACTN|nr:MFS transporter [Conexibacter arvalis]MBB4663492.1 EmrB/QacA subfamily drug resistance transporter [Conexibacter arvalis]